MNTTNLDLNADVIDSRDIIARLDEIESELEEAVEAEEIETIELLHDELNVLRDIVVDLERNCDEAPHHGIQMVRDDYFTEYAEQLAEDLGMINRDHDAGWPLRHIDWEAAAEELKVDYYPTDINGVTYWCR